MSSAAKITATKIEITFSEAGEQFCGSFDSWAGVDCRLIAMHLKAPTGGSYHKTDFKITWSDGEIYEGRIDVDGNELPDLAAHIREFCELYSGRRAPSHSTPEKWARFVAEMTTAENRASCAAVLDQCQLGD